MLVHFIGNAMTKQELFFRVPHCICDCFCPTSVVCRPAVSSHYEHRHNTSFFSLYFFLYIVLMLSHFSPHEQSRLHFVVFYALGKCWLYPQVPFPLHLCTSFMRKCRHVHKCTMRVWVFCCVKQVTLASSRCWSWPSWWKRWSIRMRWVAPMFSPIQEWSWNQKKNLEQSIALRAVGWRHSPEDEMKGTCPGFLTGLYTTRILTFVVFYWLQSVVWCLELSGCKLNIYLPKRMVCIQLMWNDNGFLLDHNAFRFPCQCCQH